MKIQQLREIARQHGMKANSGDKIELIKAIQRQEGNFDCFATAFNGVCDQVACLWRADCFTLAHNRRDS
ncbi:MAG: SAP domain-containing protein [Gammaproteobacteria bacterium]|nr:SAP domain-containing protein [Gammaproteobacteria bacterium]